MVPLDTALQVVRAHAEEWLVAATIATEVPPTPLRSPNSKEQFTAEMIMPAQQAVAEVIAHRVADPRFPKSPLAVVLQLKQFSGVLRGLSLSDVGHRDIWLEAVDGQWFPQHVAECLQAWRRVCEWARTSATGNPLVPGALWYYSPVSMLPAGRVPGWALGKTPVPCTWVAADYFRFYR